MNPSKARMIASKPTRVERTQKFLDAHPELIPEPLSYSSIGFDKCTECGVLRPHEEMLQGTCGFKCHSNRLFNLSQRSMMY